MKLGDLNNGDRFMLDGKDYTVARGGANLRVFRIGKSDEGEWLVEFCLTGIPFAMYGAPGSVEIEASEMEVA